VHYVRSKRIIDALGALADLSMESGCVGVVREVGRAADPCSEQVDEADADQRKQVSSAQLLRANEDPNEKGVTEVTPLNKKPGVRFPEGSCRH
jgi:hypothetical protein